MLNKVKLKTTCDILLSIFDNGLRPDLGSCQRKGPTHNSQMMSIKLQGITKHHKIINSGVLEAHTWSQESCQCVIQGGYGVTADMVRPRARSGLKSKPKKLNPKTLNPKPQKEKINLLAPSLDDIFTIGTVSLAYTIWGETEKALAYWFRRTNYASRCGPPGTRF